MESEADNLLSQLLQKLPVDQAAKVLETVQRLKQIREYLAEGAGLGGALFTLDPLPPGSGDLMFEVARLQLKQVEAVCNFTAKYADDVFARIRGRANATRPEAARRPTVIEFKGPLGEALPPQKVVVKNRGPAPAKAVLGKVSFIDEDGDPVGGSDQWLTISGARVVKPEQAVSLQLAVQAGAPAAPGASYVARLDVSFFGEVAERIEVVLMVEPKAKPARPAGRATGRRR